MDTPGRDGPRTTTTGLIEDSDSLLATDLTLDWVRERRSSSTS